MTWGSMQATQLDKDLNIAFVTQFSVRNEKLNNKKKARISTTETKTHCQLCGKQTALGEVISLQSATLSSLPQLGCQCVDQVVLCQII